MKFIHFLLIFTGLSCTVLTAGFGDDSPSINSSNNIITNILIITTRFDAVIFWDGKFDSGMGTEISLYRTGTKITNSDELKHMQPYRLLTNANYFEDPCIIFGVPYYYLIISGDNRVILPGENENTSPVILGSVNPAEKVEIEILSRTNENFENFIKKFNY